MMKKLMILLLTLNLFVMFAGCSSKINYDPQYGVMYLGSSESDIRITIDPKDSKTISKLKIVAAGDLIGVLKGMEAYEVNKPSDEDSSIPVEYYKNESQEIIVIRFYSDNMQKKDLETISECLGFDFTAKTDVKDLVKSDTFVYKDIIKDGELVNDISFLGNNPFKGSLN